MKQKLRESLPVKITAIGFIILIIAGNIWLIHHLTGSPVSEGLRLAGAVGLIATVLGGSGTLYLQLRDIFSERN